MSQFNPLDLAVPGIASLSPYQPGMSNEELERKYGLSHSIKLASNENPLGPSETVTEFLRKGNLNLELYPDGNGTVLKDAIAELHNVNPEQITLGNGSNDVLDLVVRAFVRSGDSGVISKYAFIVYYLSLVYAQAEIRVVNDDNFGHDLTAMQQAVDETTKIILIANPNNPTGTWSNFKGILNLLNSVPKNVIVVIDEAYAEYIDTAGYESCIPYLNDYPNLVVTRTFSKIYGLAGLRVGYSLSSPEIADLMNRVRHPFNVNNLAIQAAVIAIKDTEHVERSRQMNNEQMLFLKREYQNLGLNVIDSIGNFITVEFPGVAGDLFEYLLRRGIILRPLGPYQMPEFLRISVGTPEQNEQLLDACHEFYRHSRNSPGC